MAGWKDSCARLALVPIRNLSRKVSTRCLALPPRSGRRRRPAKPTTIIAGGESASAADERDTEELENETTVGRTQHAARMLRPQLTDLP